MVWKGDRGDPENLEDLIEKNLPILEAGDRLARVASVLSRTRLNTAIVARSGKLAGCIYRRSLLRAPISAETKTERLIFQPPTASISDRPDDITALLIQSKMDAVPVLNESSLIGSVLARDLALLTSPNGLMSDLSDSLVGPLKSGAAISDAVAVLREQDLYSIPIAGEDGQLEGWVSFPDVFRYLLSSSDSMTTGEVKGEKEKPLRNPVSSLLNQTGVTVDSSESIKSALEKMREKKTNEVTVVKDGTVLGQLSVLTMLSLLQPKVAVAVDISGAEEEDPLIVSLIAKNATALSSKLRRVWPRLRAPHIRIKSFEHELSRRKRYHIKVVFQTPEKYVAEAEGWDLLSVATRALKKVEKTMLKGKSRVIETHHRRGAYLGQ